MDIFQFMICGFSFLYYNFFDEALRTVCQRDIKNKLLEVTRPRISLLNKALNLMPLAPFMIKSETIEIDR